MLKKTLATSLTLFALISVSGFDHAFEDSPLEDIDYRHMGLYELKKNIYYHPSLFAKNGSSGSTITVTHQHHHDHWGWGFGGWGYDPLWRTGAYSSSESSDGSDSFTSRVSNGLWEVAITATIFAITAATVYTASQAVMALWPYMGAASLTAFEVPANSSWKITGYKIGNGNAITYRHFEGNQDAIESAEQGNMFDRNKNTAGQFLLVDQENWWGLTDSPTDIDITFSREQPEGQNESITINFLRAVTNGFKAGAITAQTKSSQGNSALYGPTHYALETQRPRYFEWRKWYHLPARVIIHFDDSTSY